MLQLMQQTLLPEESNFLGFLPFESYLQKAKEVGIGKRCPPEQEDIVRAFILKDSLENLGCTYKILK